MSNDYVIEARGVGRRYGARWAVRGMELAVPRGAVFGLLGLNGAGKSTTIRMLLGLIRRHEGNIAVLGLDPARQGVPLKERVGYVAEVPSFYEWMRTDEVIGFVAHYRKKNWDMPYAQQLLERFRIPTDQKVSTLSKGQRAKLSLVLALAFHPELLILDEPTSGLDPLVRREFIEGILSDFQDEGKTILISSHLVGEISGLVDHIGIIHEGRMQRSQPAEEFVKSIIRTRAQFGVDAVKLQDQAGILKQQLEGRELLLISCDMPAESLQHQLRERGAEQVQQESLNIEDAFVEYISAVERGMR